MANNLTEIKKAQIDVELKAIFNFIKQKLVENRKNYEIIKKDNHTIKFQVSFFSKSSVFYNNKLYSFHNNSRDITFMNLVNSTKQIIFVYNEDIIEEYMEKNGFKFFYLNDSHHFEDDITGFLNGDQNIIIFGKDAQILTEKRFQDFIDNKTEIRTLEDLSINSSFYYGQDYKNPFYLFNEYENYLKELSTLLRKEQIIQVFGPKGCFKTTFLLFLKFYLIQEGKAVFYINYEYLFKNPNQIKEILYNELLYSAVDSKNVGEIYKFGLLDDIKSGNLISDIQIIIESYEEKMEKKFNFRKVIILDNVKHLNQRENKILEDLIFKFKSNTKNRRCSLIICGEGEFFNKNIRINISGIERGIKIFKLTFNNILNEQVTECLGKKFSYFKNSSFFINENNLSDKENDKSELIKEENEYCKNYKFHYLFFMYEYNDYCFSLKDFGEFDIFDFFPNYYNIDIVLINKEVILSLNNEIFQKAIMNQIAFDVQKSVNEDLLFNKKFPKFVFGLGLEFLVILLFSYNKFGFGNLRINRQNIFEIETISKIKDLDYINKLSNPKLFQGSILIHQEKFRGEFYDLLIIHSTNNTNTAIFIQIGTDKSEQQIYKIKKDLDNYQEYYKTNLGKVLGIIIHKISLLFIFDFHTQQSGRAQGQYICSRKDINFYLFNIEDFKLYRVIDEISHQLSDLEIEDFNIIKENKEIIPLQINNFFVSIIKPKYKLNREILYELEKKISTIKGREIFINLFNPNEYRESTNFDYFLNKLNEFPHSLDFLHVLRNNKTKEVIFYFNDIAISEKIKFDKEDSFSWDIYHIQ